MRKSGDSPNTVKWRYKGQMFYISPSHLLHKNHVMRIKENRYNLDNNILETIIGY